MNKVKLEHYVVFSLVMVTLYTIAEFIAGCWGINHDTLTTCFFAVFGGEVLSCALIKVFKLRSSNDNADDFGNDIN